MSTQTGDTMRHVYDILLQHGYSEYQDNYDHTYSRWKDLRIWYLRVASLKQMAILFCAYDQTTYQRLIPNHLADIQNYPTKIIDCLKKAAFAVDIGSSNGHCRFGRNT